jgi:CheY-like chemotaxis protein
MIKILAIDDNQDNLTSLKAILDDGFYVLEAKDGNAGVEITKPIDEPQSLNTIRVIL